MLWRSGLDGSYVEAELKRWWRGLVEVIQAAAGLWGGWGFQWWRAAKALDPTGNAL